MKKVLIAVIFLALASSAVSLEIFPKIIEYSSPSPLPETFEVCDILIFENYGLEKLEVNKFVNLRDLSELHTTGNQLKILGGSEFDNLQELQVLNLKFNAISKIPRNEFTNLQKLRELNLNENSISFVDKDLFPFSLEVITMSANDIAKLHYKTFSRLASLRKLDVSFNALTALHGELFAGNEKLEELNMHGNRLMHIGPQIFDKLPKLAVADFEKNPCVNSWIKANKIATLNQTIHEACAVTSEVKMEFLQEEVQHLTEENESLKTGNGSMTKQNDGQCSTTTVAPVDSPEDPTTITISSIEYARMQKESNAMKEEIEKLKALGSSKASGEIKDKASDNSSCEAELEKLQLEMNIMEENHSAANKSEADYTIVDAE